MKLNEINIRDPFVLLYENKYYMYGSRVGVQSGFDVYVSTDLENWDEPKSIFELSGDFWATKDCWAPEVHFYGGKFYMLASFKADNVCRGTAILVSDTPDGTFEIHSPRITPPNWECLDGTLYVEDDIPYMVFCREWCQIHNGEIWAVKLSADLKKAVEQPFLLWKAGDAKWVLPISETDGVKNYVTDGPFLFKTDGGCLKCLWSSFSNDGYVLAASTSDNGSISGNWKIDDNLLYTRDGGHGMIFETKNGTKIISVHSPNTAFNERPKFLKM